ncbi:leucyl aminopeptidase [Tessaracoccus rhinocerotis]|uniref:Probable cytosol aminopeptidase n=1 Tax=Tessaracoccus rhinocerotis TaxID=1689449 RepID=A0A553K2C2_9ACTN|nr:leucyl aminopeptidase [Tessaracoccus rhinocerotis]TRY18828.1 leucyl aminopeptidase [Tessaracoccus rhinocerotis]
MTRTLPDLKLSATIEASADVVVLGLAETSGRPTLVGATPELERAARKALSEKLLDLALSLGATTKLGSTVVLPPCPRRVVVVGLGDVDVTPDRLRRATGCALRTVAGLSGAKQLSVAVSLELADPELVQAAAEGSALGAYSAPRVSRSEQQAAVEAITLVAASSGPLKQAISTATVVSEAVYRARDWVNLPPNVLYPETFAEQARTAFRDERVTVEVLDEKALEKGGYGGILAVGGGSSRKPRLVRMQYSPRGAKFHLALVGKGITFDSGGLDIKPAGGMAGMKFDMSGAAAVISAVKAIAALGLRIKVTGYAAMAENMPSGSAYRSGDVLTMFDGQTVENYNTDAEGRLVMADAIGRAALDQPDMIVDVATLTGACMVALGMRIAGLMASDDETADRVLDAAEAAGEEFWQLPITDDVREQLKSDIADFRSGGKNRWGGALHAAAFLQRFVPDGVTWAHLDIAGPANNEDAPHGYTPKGGTGVAVRTLVALATQLAAQ